MPNVEYTHTDALGQEVVIGSWYGYSRNASGVSHVNVGMAKTTSKGKVRLEHCMVLSYLYGTPTNHRVGNDAPDLSIGTNMVFPVSKEQVEKFAQIVLTWPGLKDD